MVLDLSYSAGAAKLGKVTLVATLITGLPSCRTVLRPVRMISATPAAAFLLLIGHHRLEPTSRLALAAMRFDVTQFIRGA